MTRNAKLTLTAMCLALMPLWMLSPVQTGAEDPPKSSPPPAGQGGTIGGQPAPESRGMRDKGQGLSEDQEKELLEVLKARKSDYYDNLIKLKETNQQVYKQMIRRFWMHYQEIKTMPKDLQEVAFSEQDLKISIWKVSDEIRGAKSKNEDQKVQEGTAKLKDLVTQQFDAEMKMTEYRLNQFEERLKKLREDLKQRGEKRDQLIEQRLQEYLRDNPATMPAPGGKHNTPPRSGEVKPEQLEKEIKSNG